MNLPKKSLGQNFLKDKNICYKIIKQTKVKGKQVLEIGPGYGFLSDIILSEKPKELILIEKDNDLYNYLKLKYKFSKIVTIINDDILNVDLENVLKNKCIVISNLPYNLSSKIILYLFTINNKIDELVLMIQKEMANKYDYNLPKLNKYKFYTKIISVYKKCFNVPANVFFPKPKVQSSVVKFKFLNTKKINWKKIKLFADIIFKDKRKIIGNKIKLNNNNLKILNSKRIDEISIKEILRIYNSF